MRRRRLEVWELWRRAEAHIRSGPPALDGTVEVVEAHRQLPADHNLPEVVPADCVAHPAANELPLLRQHVAVMICPTAMDERVIVAAQRAREVVDMVGRRG